jgi:hypothetical protein
MSKLYCIHDIELYPGVNEAAFSQFFNQEMAKIYEEIDWRTILLKADRGQRAGQYAVLIELDSQEARDRISPTPNSLSEEAQRVWAENQERMVAIQSKWETFSPTNLPAHLEYTDYIVVK